MASSYVLSTIYQQRHGDIVGYVTGLYYLLDNVIISECPVGNILYTPDNNKDNIKLKLMARVIQEWRNELIYT